MRLAPVSGLTSEAGERAIVSGLTPGGTAEQRFVPVGRGFFVLTRLRRQEIYER